MSRTMARALGLAALGYAHSAAAQEVTLKPLVDARLRYEHVDQTASPTRQMR